MATKPKAPALTTPGLFEADELLALARLDIEGGKLDEALWKLKQVLTETTPPAEALAMAARLYAQLGLWERAKPLFQRYIEAEPKAMNEIFQLGMVNFDGGAVKEALAIWAGLLKDHPTHPPALFFTALAYSQTGQMTEARHGLEVLLKSAPADNLYFTRGKELLHAIENQPAQGRGVETLRIAPKDAYKAEH
jgi:tetratricopeptide (TPR) repeat protein